MTTHKIAHTASYGGLSLTIEAVRRGRELSGDPAWLGITDQTYLSSIADGYYVPDEHPRHDLILVKVIEEFGERAGNAAVTEIEGDRYWIEDYDGKETVHTPESIEWVTIS